MIFAHGPLGFLTSFTTKRLWTERNGVTKRTTYLFMILGYIGGIFPDIDLFYFYLIDASSSHRGFITHTPFFYLVVCGALIALSLVLKKRVWAIGAGVFMLGALSHLFTDMVVAQIIWLYPFSDRFFGLTDLNNEIINTNILFLNFLLEGICFFFFFYVLIWVLSKTVVQRWVATVCLLAVFVAGLVTLYTANQHVYHGESVMPYGDQDDDRISNLEDRDLDGDGQLNIDDLDSDNDGKSNVEEVTINTEDFVGGWYDRTNGGLLQIPIRLGFITNDDIVRRVLGTFGIFLNAEMQADYAQHPAGYALPPTDSNFDRSNANIKTWFEHRGALETGSSLAAGRNQLGDVLFFESGYVAIVSGFTEKGETNVLDVHKDRGTHEVLLPVVEQAEGQPIARGKLLNPTPLYQQ